MTDARLDAVHLAALTDGTPAARLDSVYLTALTDGTPAARLDGVYLSVLTAVSSPPMTGYWGILADNNY